MGRNRNKVARSGSAASRKPRVRADGGGWRGQLPTIMSGAIVAVLALLLGSGWSPIGRELEKFVSAFTGADRNELQVTVHPVANPCLQKWGLPPTNGYKPPTSSTEAGTRLMNEPGAIEAWVKEHDAAAIGGLTIEVVVSGSKDASTVTLHDVQVRVLERGEPPQLEPLALDCGGQGTFSWFRVPLDELPEGRPVSVREIYQRWPSAAVAPPDPADDPADADLARSVKPLRLPLEVSSTDTEPLLLEAVASRCDCRWDVTLVWSAPGEPAQTRRIDFDGRPFRTSAEPE